MSSNHFCFRIRTDASDIISVPKTQRLTKLLMCQECVKRNNHTHKNNLVIDAACKVVLLTPTCEGRIHDKRIADATRYCLPNGSTLFQDPGFQGFSLQGINIIEPKKKPKGRDLTLEEKERNRLISSIRVRVEHVMSGIKRYRIVKDKLRNLAITASPRMAESGCRLPRLLRESGTSAKMSSKWRDVVFVMVHLKICGCIMRCILSGMA